jgi:hypothetical protein
MIAFVTLLLGLISGNYPIEVTVSGPVAAVDFSLDGTPAGRLDHAPWIAKINLGTDLRPHELVARALDAEGKEIARAAQWLNLPRPPAEVEIVLESGEGGVPRAAALTWQAVNGVKPSSIGLTLDGQPLAVDSNGRAALPSRDLKTLHVLTAELWFPLGVVARKDVVFGGEYGSEVSTELTAVPVRFHGEIAPTPQELQGRFVAQGRPVPVAAVEDGPGKVVVVRVPTATELVERLIPQSRHAFSLLPSFRQELPLGDDDGVLFLSLKNPIAVSSRVPSELFAMTREYTRKDGGMFWFLSDTRLPPDSRKEGLRITDALAVAGLQAAVDNHRRAVVLVLGNDIKDISHYDPASVRAYLDSIRVPLFVWSLYGANAPATKGWGTAEDISTLPKLRKAVDKLRAELESQKIVWIEGRYLPQDVAVMPQAAPAGGR